jgi:phosphatidylserine/phosphatidylglycerophosphate/cardiolipin synthase-like enzyme
VRRPPTCAFYGNLRHASLAAVLEPLAHEEEALTRFLDLGPVPTLGDPPTGGRVAAVLPVNVGDEIGELGEIVLDDGTSALALDFGLALGPDGRDTIYPDAFYDEVMRLAGWRLVHGSDLSAPEWERHPELSIWSVCTPRVILHLRDEWHHGLGQYRGADLALVRDDGERLTWSHPPLPEGQPPTASVALGAWVVGHASATLEAHPHAEPGADALMLSPVPSSVAAAQSVDVELLEPREITVQALDPADWFPRPGGRGWEPVTAVHTDVVLPAPHAVAPWTNGNAVTPLLDGQAYFADLARELDRIDAGDHYLCQAGWWTDHRFPLTQVTDHAPVPAVLTGPDARTLGDHWDRIAAAGASIFELVWNPTGGPHTWLPDAIPPGRVHDLWESIEDFDEDMRSLAVALTNPFGPAFGPPHAPAVAAVNGLPGTGRTEAILDGRHRPAASHHAKQCAIRNADGLVAWVGGIDLNEDRTNSAAHHDHSLSHFPHHDVQCRIEGPAARDVLRTFLSRWNDHPKLDAPTPANGKTTDLQCPALGFAAAGHELALEEADDRTGGTNLVQISRTFGNCRGLLNAPILDGGAFETNGGYTFAPDGEFTIESAVLGAIKRAKRFVYIEDQFLGSMKIATAVADKIAERKAALEADPEGEEPFFVYLVVPYFPEVETELGLTSTAAWHLARLRHLMASGPRINPSLYGRILDLLGEQDAMPEKLVQGDPWGYLNTRWHDLLSSVDPRGDHWRMHCLRLPPFKRPKPVYSSSGPAEPDQVTLEDRRIYVHTKITIVDDVWATIGSANMCVRSHTLDTEINCCFVDGRTDDRGLRTSVRDLRRALWAEHLDIPLADFPVEAGNHPWLRSLWERRTTSAAELPPTGSGERPWGGRTYPWPYAEIGVGKGAPPVLTWSPPIPIEEFGVSAVPQYWWLTEQHGKAPWIADVERLMPPRIGSQAFAFDGQDGAAYAPYDLAEHIE